VLAAPRIALDGDDPFVQEQIADLNCLGEKTARIIAEVENQALRTLIQQRLQGRGDPVCRRVVEFGELDIADVVLQHARVHRRHDDASATNRHSERLSFIGTRDLQGDLAAFWATDQADCLVEAHAYDGDVVYLQDQVAGLEASRLGRLTRQGPHDFEIAVLAHSHGRPDALEFACGVLIPDRSNVRLDEGSVRIVERREHAPNRAVRERGLIRQAAVVFLVEDVENLAQHVVIQLPIGSRL